MKTKPNTMNHADHYRLCKWIEGHSVEASKSRASLLASAASRDLDRPVSPYHINKARRTLGIKCVGAPMGDRFDVRISNLAELVCEMADRLGQPVPQAVRKLI